MPHLSSSFFTVSLRLLSLSPSSPLSPALGLSSAPPSTSRGGEEVAWGRRLGTTPTTSRRRPTAWAGEEATPTRGGKEAASAASAGDVCICSADSLDLHASQRTSPSSLARRANSRGSRRLDAERPSATIGGGSGDL
uniref:Uncharacterized protein n=1 Tax=Oryza nivara TaxID=4536 RepID=A0A0E0I5P9_ORYNI